MGVCCKAWDLRSASEDATVILNFRFSVGKCTMRISVLFLLVIAALASGCSPGSLKDFRHEGESACRDIVADLQSIENREDLMRMEPILKKRFEKLVSLIIEARQFQIAYPEEALSVQMPQENDLSDVLKEELERVYSIEGGKEIVERAEREAMLKLDAFEKMREKQKELRIK